MKLRDAHWQALSATCRDIAQVALASIAIPFFLDTFRPTVGAWGLALAFLFWTLGLYFLRFHS